MTTQQSAADQISAANNAFLQYARRTYDIIQLGTITGNPASGPGAVVVWNKVVDTAPAWAEYIVLNCSVPYSLSVPAGATVYVSPFFPFNMFSHTLTLAGAPPFPTSIPGTVFMLDEMTSFANKSPQLETPGIFVGGGINAVDLPGKDDMASGQTGQPANSVANSIQYSTGNANLTPGGTYHNTTTATAVLTGTATFTYRIRLRRRRNTLVGYVPLGDPENRPVLNMYLNVLVSGFPEKSPFQDVAAAGITCVLNGTVNVNATWWSRQLDLTPPGMGVLDQPTVVMGFAIDSNNGVAIPNAGQFVPVTKRFAMVYEKMFLIVINNQQVQAADYFGLWTTSQQQAARREFDATQNNLYNYKLWEHDTYQRFFPYGTYIDDLFSGDIPELPNITPYKGLMSPDVNYANLIGVAPTPAMQEVVRIPAGVTMNSAYVISYDLGLVSVPY